MSGRFDELKFFGAGRFVASIGQVACASKALRLSGVEKSDQMQDVDGHRGLLLPLVYQNPRRVAIGAHERDLASGVA